MSGPKPLKGVFDHALWPHATIDNALAAFPPVGAHDTQIDQDSWDMHWKTGDQMPTGQGGGFSTTDYGK